MWQALHEELASHGLSIITIAVDQSLDAARPYVLDAGATHPSLVDTEHRVVDLYNMVNVPTVVWIDEEGRIVRPNDVHFVSDEYAQFTKFHPRKPTQALRDWVHGRSGPLASSLAGKSIDELVPMPTENDQLARAMFAIGWELAQRGDAHAADRWFVAAGDAAPHDFTIRRGSMPIRGLDAGGPEFFKMTEEWRAAGNEYYVPLADLKSSAEDFELQPVPDVDLVAIRERDRLLRERFAAIRSATSESPT